MNTSDAFVFAGVVLFFDMFFGVTQVYKTPVSSNPDHISLYPLLPFCPPRPFLQPGTAHASRSSVSYVAWCSVKGTTTDILLDQGCKAPSVTYVVKTRLELNGSSRPSRSNMIGSKMELVGWFNGEGIVLLPHRLTYKYQNA